MSYLNTIGRRLLDIVYPPHCVSCGSGGSWWCASCRSSVDRPERDPCPRCLSTDAIHDCSRTVDFTSIHTTGFYHSKALRSLIAELKYSGVTAGAADVEAYLHDVFGGRLPIEGPVSIQPMPLDADRERDRGFNQSQWIAERVQNSILPGADIIDMLERLPSAAAQATLQKEDRSVNIANTIAARGHISGSVLLVDDVATTGATAHEAAEALRRAGAEHVYLFTLAIGA